MQLPRKWNNSDLVSSQLLHLIFNSKTSNPNSKPYSITDRKISHKSAFQTNQVTLFMLTVVFMIGAMSVGTKRLAFGITIFAFVLLVLEYVCSFSSCSSGFQLLIRSCFPLLSTSLRFDRLDRINSCEISDDIGLSDYAATVCKEISISDDSIVKEQNVMVVKKIAREGEECIDEVKNSTRKSRREILKAKIIRRLVPKKLRHSKYYKMSVEKFEDRGTDSMKVMEEERSVGSLTIRQVISEVESDNEETNYLNFRVKPDHKVDDDSKHSDELSCSSEHSLKSDADSVIFGSRHTSELVKSKSVAANTQFDYARGKSGYMMLIVIVVLVGLIGGRILSFFLAIGYFCIVKYISGIN